MGRLKPILIVAALVLAGVFLLGGVGYRNETEYQPTEENWLELEPGVNLQNTGTSNRFLGFFGRWDHGSPFTLFVDLTVEAADVEIAIVKVWSSEPKPRCWRASTSSSCQSKR